MCSGFSVLGFFPGCALLLGGRGMADLSTVVGATPPISPCLVPAKPGSKFKAKVALLSNSMTLPARLPSEGKSHSYTRLC